MLRVLLLTLWWRDIIFYNDFSKFSSLCKVEKCSKFAHMVWFNQLFSSRPLLMMSIKFLSLSWYEWNLVDEKQSILEELHDEEAVFLVELIAIHSYCLTGVNLQIIIGNLIISAVFLIVFKRGVEVSFQRFQPPFSNVNLGVGISIIKQFVKIKTCLINVAFLTWLKILFFPWVRKIYWP